MKRPARSKAEHRILALGRLWRWGSIALILLVPVVVFCICNLLPIPAKNRDVAAALSAGLTLIGVGGYDILGAVRQFRHVLVALQLSRAHLPSQGVRPYAVWTAKDKKDCIGSGVLLIALGAAMLIFSVLYGSGIVHP